LNYLLNMKISLILFIKKNKEESELEKRKNESKEIKMEFKKSLKNNDADKFKSIIEMAIKNKINLSINEKCRNDKNINGIC